MLKRQITGLYKQLPIHKLFLLLILILSFFLPTSLLSSITPVQAAALSLPPETLFAGTDSGLRGDDRVSSTLEIGFSFTYYGNTYTQFNATTNGLIGFNGGATTTYGNTSLPNSSAPNNAIYGFWDDLYSYDDTQLVLYRTIGNVGSRVLIVQWTNYGYFNSDLPMGTFQIILYEGSNNIRMQYRQLLTDPRSYGDSATIGVENATGTVATLYSCNTVSLDNEQSILWTWNGSNNYTYDAGAAYEGVFLYKDNPPPNVPELTAPANGSAGVSTTPTFSWNAALNASTYNLTVSRYANLSSPVISQTGLTTTSYAGSGLSDGPTYYWGVEAVNAYGSTWSSIWTFTTAAGNSAPNDISLSNNTIAAGLPANTEVGTLSTTDPDAGDTFTYTLVEGGGSSDNSSFVISGNSLRTNASLSGGDYTIRVRSADQDGLYTEKSFTITVASSNNAPTDISLSSTSISENQGADAVVGALSTTDPDSGDSFTYTLVSGTGDSDNGAFNISGTSLRANSSLDFETKSSYSVRVRSTDSGGLFTEKQFAISVTNTVENTTTSISSDTPDPSVVGQNYAVAVTVAPSSGTGTPTGTVNVSDGDNSCSITLSSGTGSCSLPSVTPGSLTITANYSGDSNWNSSSDTESHTIIKASTTTTITSDSPDPSERGNNYSVSVTVAAVSPGAGTPTGTVNVSDGDNSCSITLSSGTGSCSLPSATPGSLTITATYSGDSNWNSSSDTESHTIIAASTSTTITSDSPDPSEWGNNYSVSVTVAAVSPGAGTPTGTVEISNGSDGCTITLSSGTGSCNLPSSSLGTFTITAFYAGDSNWNSSSDTESHTIIKASTTTTITSDSPDPSEWGNNYSVNVTVAAVSPGVGTPTGTVEVSNGSDGCTVTLSSGTGSCNLPSPTTGTFTITATYSGDTNFAVSSDTESHVVEDTTPPTVTVNQASSQSDPTNGMPIVFDVLFNEAIQSFSPDDVSFNGSTAPGTLSASIGGAGPDFKVFVSGMTGSGDVVVSIPANRVQDITGNFNEASTSTDNTVTYDVTPPSVTIEQGASQPDPTNSEPIVFDVEFSEPVLGFSSSDVIVSGMANTPSITVTGTGSTYTVEISGVADGEIISAEIVSNAAMDFSGNPSLESTSVDNLVEYDISSIEVVLDAGLIGNPGSIVIAQNGNYLTKFTELSVEFDSDAYNPPGSTDEDDVTNPDNYYLLRPGDNYVFNVSTCPQIALIGSTEELDDIVVPIGPVSYDNNGGAGPFIANLTVNNGMRLPLDKYRLIICGSTTITDIAGNPLNDGVDVVIDFSIQQLPGTLPNTGFPMGAVTTIPKQPEASVYNSTGMFISLPKLGVSAQIIGVPLESNGWNTFWLGNYAGFLEGSVFPTWNGNTVITGHVWTATNQPGIFVDLADLEYGDEIKIFAWGQVYTYEVRSNRVVSDTNVSSVMRSESRDWVTLMTCDTYDPETGTFINRRIIRAILIEIDL